MANEIKSCISYTWEKIGHVEKSSGNTLKFNCEITKSPGVYKLVVNECKEIYVGEGQSLETRINNYAKAGWYANATVEYTNRRVQGWLLAKLIDMSLPEIHICTKAFISFQQEESKELVLVEKSNRLVIENLEIANLQPDWKLLNKKIWAKTWLDRYLKDYGVHNRRSNHDNDRVGFSTIFNLLFEYLHATPRNLVIAGSCSTNCDFRI